MNPFLRLFFLILALTGTLMRVQAQVAVNSFTSLNQNFNSLPVADSSNWSNNATIKGWYILKNGATPASIVASNGSTVSAGVKSFGSEAASERALGSANVSSGQAYYGIQLKNNTGTIIKRFAITYTLELWAKPNGNKTVTVNFHSQVGTNTVLTSGTWVAQSAGSITRKTGGGHAKPLDGNLVNYRTTITFNTSDINLAANGTVMLRWSDLNTNGVYCAIDDITITSTNNTIYYSKPTGDLTSVATWGTNSDGSGTNPLLFANATFIFANRTQTTLTKNWVVLGTGKVVVSAGALIIPANFAYSGIIDVANDAYLAIANPNIPTFGSIGDNSTIVFNGNFDQYLPFADYSNLNITGNGLKQLSTHTTVRKSLTFTAGKLQLNDFNLTLYPGANISGANAAGYIITNSTGTLIQEVANDGVEVMYPVGPSATVYSPAILAQTATGATDNFKIRVTDKIYIAYDKNLPIGEELTSKVVNKTWVLDEEVIGGSEITLTTGWAAEEAAADFEFLEGRIRHYHNDAWDDTKAEKFVLSDGYYYVTRPNITSFSPFGVFSGSSGTLPVTLVSFIANRTENAVTTQWKTASEKDNDYFTIERSLNGKEFTAVGKVKGAGTTNNVKQYSFRDAQAPKSTVYYRLKQTDLDGTTAYSQIVAVNATNTTAEFTLYPNPATVLQTLKTNGLLTGAAQITIRNNQGQQVKQYQTESSQLSQGIDLDIALLAKGLYLVEIKHGSQKTILKSIKH